MVAEIREIHDIHDYNRFLDRLGIWQIGLWKGRGNKGVCAELREAIKRSVAAGYHNSFSNEQMAELENERRRLDQGSSCVCS